jgi:5'-nucleotidase
MSRRRDTPPQAPDGQATDTDDAALFREAIGPVREIQAPPPPPRPPPPRAVPRMAARDDAEAQDAFRRMLAADTWCVHGTPTDCVHVAITGMLELEPDIVVSGINTTANLGDDVIYSGTVAAAMEGRFLGLPAVAMSLAHGETETRHYETAARAAVEIIARLLVDPLPADTILNVNVPDLPWESVRGFEVSRLGNRHRAEPCIQQEDPRGRSWWWIGAAGAEQDAGPGTDFHAVRTGHISITPIQVDLTRYQALEQVASWVGGLEASLAAPDTHGEARGSAA